MVLSWTIGVISHYKQGMRRGSLVEASSGDGAKVLIGVNDRILFSLS